MKILSKVADFLGGSLFEGIKETVMAYCPPDLNPVQKAEFELKLQKHLNDKQLETSRLLNESTIELNKRIAEQEGTASDLKTIPILGPIVIFLRGLQRPVWGFATLYMDNKWFFGSGNYTEKQETAMIVINILVLGFLFGERTIKNLQPLIIQVFGKKPNK